MKQLSLKLNKSEMIALGNILEANMESAVNIRRAFQALPWVVLSEMYKSKAVSFKYPKDKNNLSLSLSQAIAFFIITADVDSYAEYEIHLLTRIRHSIHQKLI
jgi:hypothetical protein